VIFDLAVQLKAMAFDGRLRRIFAGSVAALPGAR
jgi:hypothetical protein